jgi:hypothetical protein
MYLIGGQIMKTQRILVTMLALLIVHCGKIDPNTTEKLLPDETKKTDKETKDTKDNAKEQSPEYPTSQLVQGERDLPACDEARERQLIYVIETAQFKTCSSDHWKVVDLKGQAGKDGKDGTSGSNGKDGVAGTNGKDGKDGQVVNGNMWYDVVTKKYWLIPSTASATANPEICANGWRFPLESEVPPARERGLKTAADAVGAPSRLYAQTPTPNYYVTRTVRSNASDSGNYCIQE